MTFEIELLTNKQVVCYVSQILSQCVQQDETGSRDEKKNASRNPPAANGHAQLCFCWHGEEEDMKMQIRVADGEENGH